MVFYRKHPRQQSRIKKTIQVLSRITICNPGPIAMQKSLNLTLNIGCRSYGAACRRIGRHPENSSINQAINIVIGLTPHDNSKSV